VELLQSCSVQLSPSVVRILICPCNFPFVACVWCDVALWHCGISMVFPAVYLGA